MGFFRIPDPGSQTHMFESLVTIFCRVWDPHCFNADPDTDPDPAFFLIADPDSGSGSRV
jgi:hypothetical protein